MTDSGAPAGARALAEEPSLMLAEFHAAVSHPDTDALWLRRTLHDEEHAELVEALEAAHAAPDDDATREALKQVARELADVVYVAFGTAHAAGIDLDVALTEVHRANMQKARGPRRADGKALKPADFVPPDMAAAVQPASAAHSPPKASAPIPQDSEAGAP